MEGTQKSVAASAEPHLWTREAVKSERAVFIRFLRMRHGGHNKLYNQRRHWSK